MKKIFAGLIAGLLFASPALADSTINGLSAGTALTGPEQLPMFQSANPAVTTTPNALATYIAAHPGYIANTWYAPVNTIGEANPSGALPANTVACFYGTIPQIVTIQAVGFRITTLAAAGNYTAAIYSNSGGRPGSLITSIASQSTGATGSFSVALGANKQLGPGGAAGGRDIWLCSNQDNSTAAYAAPAQSTGDQYMGGALANVTAQIWGVTCSGATACGGATSSFSAGSYTWPASLSGTTWGISTSQNIPKIWFEALTSP